MTFSPSTVVCVTRLIGQSNVQSNTMLVGLHDRRGLSSGDHMRNAVAASWPFAVYCGRDGAGLRARICSSVMRPAAKSSRRLRGTSEPLPPLGGRQLERALRGIDGRVRELIVTVDRRRAADRDALEITRVRIVSVRMSVDVDVPAGHELLRLPARAPDQRGRAHLAAHLQRLAVGVDGLEIQIRMRIDELELRQRARVVLEFLHLK